jgi:uncharacterized protein (DUF427 family)
MWRHCGQRRPTFAHEPGPGQESVWDYPRPPRIIDDARHVTVLGGGRAVADTRAALRVCETASPPTFYLPAVDVALELLAEVGARTFCEWKGDARYFALAGDIDQIPVAWDYPHPSRAFARLAGHLAFYPSALECFVDGERVRPQPGRFYGGWITDDVVGPFKGEPGTGHW